MAKRNTTPAEVDSIDSAFALAVSSNEHNPECNLGNIYNNIPRSGFISLMKPRNQWVDINNNSEVLRLGCEIDKTIFNITQTYATMMNGYMRDMFDGNNQITVAPGRIYGSMELQCQQVIWSQNIKLLGLWQMFYNLLNDSAVFRVYTNEPIIIPTPTGSGYIVIHPSIQQNIKQGVDEVGPYYEVNLGGLNNHQGVVGQSSHLNMGRPFR